MEKLEMQRFVRQKFKAMGFYSRKNKFHKLIGDDYLIGVTMDAGYAKSYQFYCGVIYLPDEKKMPFRGVFDISQRYVFPLMPDEDPDVQRCLDSMEFRRIVEYEKYTPEQLDRVLDANYEYYLKPMLDQEWGLQKIRDNWLFLRDENPSKKEMLCKRAGLDINAVNEFLNSRKTASQVLHEVIKSGQLETLTKTADFGEVIAQYTENSPES